MGVRQPIIRPAIITGNVDTRNQTCNIKFTDRSDNREYSVTLPHPMASNGWGVFAAPTPGTRVLVDFQQQERPQIVNVVPSNAYSQDFSSHFNITDISVDEPEYPDLRPGEIALQSLTGSNFCLFRDGRINLQADQINVEYSPEHNVASEKIGSRYVNTDAHREISGSIKRDRREIPKEIESILDKLFNPNVDAPLTTIGRNPLLPSRLLTVNLNQSNESLRNPALVEHHSIIYEFSRPAMVQDHEKEVARLRGEGGDFLSQNDRRDMARTDVLNLGLHLPNNLIERVEGTVVDIYGNVLDINRNVIKFNELIKDEELKNFDKRVNLESALLRRSIKYHFELNARKENLSEASTDVLDGVNPDDPATATGYSHSRLSVDVDGEGFVKFNIPATSNVGNIPLLSRYVNAHNPDDRNAWEYRNSPRVDVQHMGFGNTELGVNIPEEYAPNNILQEGAPFKYRTAYHEILNTASEILLDAGTTPVADSISNVIDFGEGGVAPNAGGRSIHGNLDGSLELNIGRDVIDKKSIVLDTAGSFVSRWGKDERGNSIVSQTDGDVLVQVGGDAVEGDEVTADNKVAIFVKNGSGFHKLEFKEEGIFITSAPNTNLVLESSKNLVLSAKGETLLGGESISLYGKFSNNGSTVEGERLVTRSGKEIK